jgi:ribosomal protein S18 acetylase RimI-like enzyme
MTLSDYDECFELWNIKGDAISRADSTRETFSKIIARNPETCFVAVADNKIIGTIAAEFGGDGAYISHLNVSPRFRRQGIATAMVNTAEGKLTNSAYVNRVFLFSQTTKQRNFFGTVVVTPLMTKLFLWIGSYKTYDPQRHTNA